MGHRAGSDCVATSQVNLTDIRCRLRSHRPRAAAGPSSASPSGLLVGKQFGTEGMGFGLLPTPRPPGSPPVLGIASCNAQDRSLAVTFSVTNVSSPITHVAFVPGTEVNRHNFLIFGH